MGAEPEDWGIHLQPRFASAYVASAYVASAYGRCESTLNHRRPAIPFSDAPRGTCRWCGEPILYESGAKRGSLDRRRRWHPACSAVYDSTDPRELRRRVRRRDRGVCALCHVNTNQLRRAFKGRGMWARMREKGFVPRRSLWELDHKIPLIDGGTHGLSNLQTLCVPCHHNKSAREHSERAAQNRERGRGASAGDGSG